MLFVNFQLLQIAESLDKLNNPISAELIKTHYLLLTNLLTNTFTVGQLF